MSTTYTPIDLSTVPAPNVVEALSYETILAAMLADLRARDTAFTALVESDPAYKILEVAAYRELLIRQRVNDGARAVMLAYATGSDLENLSALFGVTRKILSPGDATALPPILPTYETDTALRYRTQLALEGLSSAGPVGAYQFHALSVDGVKDAGIQGPPDTDPGDVLVTILSATGSGTAAGPLIAAVNAALNAEDVRPLTDQVTVQSASIVNYEVIATLYIPTGPDPTAVQTAALASVQAFVESRHRVGADVRLSGLYAALHVGGVERVTLSAPGITADLVITAVQAPWCTDITLSTTDA
jgi:phage-related baseplate assembly protein